MLLLLLLDAFNSYESIKSSRKPLTVLESLRRLPVLLPPEDCSTDIPRDFFTLGLVNDAAGGVNGTAFTRGSFGG